MGRRYEGFICDGCSNLCEDYYPGIDMCPYDENLRCDCGYNIKCPMRQQKNTRAPKINRVRHKQLERARNLQDKRLVRVFDVNIFLSLHPHRKCLIGGEFDWFTGCHMRPVTDHYTVESIDGVEFLADKECCGYVRPSQVRR